MNYQKEIYFLGDMAVIYFIARDIPAVTVVPRSMAEAVNDDKMAHMLYPAFGHCAPMPMADIALQGDGCSQNFSAGNFMHMTETSRSMRFSGRKKSERGNRVEIVTELSDGRIRAEHTVAWKKDGVVLEFFIKAVNISARAETLEALPSFQICGLTPFGGDNDSENIDVCELQNNWSGEGRLRRQTAAELGFFDSWSHFGMRGYRIGQKGSMPARMHLPFLALEDKNAGVVWAAEIEAGSSWQMEVIHNTNSLSLSGGQADFNFGHWRKRLAPGESFTTQKGFVTCVCGNLEEACSRLVTRQKKELLPCEKDFPVIFNEYFVGWGSPSMKLERPLIRAASALKPKYFVMDAGWYKQKTDSWNSIGDWNVNEEAFPQGLRGYADEVRAAGMIPGVWYEFECVSEDSTVFREHPDWLLRRDGKTIVNGGRAFLDFRNPAVHAYLKEKVIDRLAEAGIGYLKVDYNDNVGIGADGAESYGEALRQHIEGVRKFFLDMKAALPGLLIEMCSSGGMRHTPFWLSLGDMCSFSDAHFRDDGVPIAIGLHRYLSPEMMQIWAEVNASHSERQLTYTLSKGMLGRVCLSGKIGELDNCRLRILRRGLEFYGRIKNAVVNGKTDLIQDDAVDLNQIGNKTFALSKAAGGERLVYVFFHGAGAQDFEAEFSEKYILADTFGNADFTYGNGVLRVKAPGEERGSLIAYFKKEIKG